MAPAEAARKKQANQPNNRYASIVIDAASGVVISERHADKILYPASLTKMMTLYMLFEAIDQGKIRKNQRIPVSSRAAAQVPSKIGIPAGGSIRVEDAILALVTKSANDIAVAVAEAVGGTEARFGQMMTQRARQLGMTRSNFVNASGLHNPRQTSTARDMATLGRALMRDFPHEYRYFKTPSFTYAGVTHRNHNRLLQTYQGMDGLKTGYVYASGYNLAASAVRDGRRLIGVVFGGRTPVTRNSHMADILDAGFAQLDSPRIARQIGRPQGGAVGQIVFEEMPPAHLASASGVALPARKPATMAAVSAVDRVLASRRTHDDTPAQGTLGLVGIQQGDREDGSDSLYIRNPRESDATLARTTTSRDIDGVVRRTLGADETWAVQVGAFSSQDAGMIALRNVRARLPENVTRQSEYTIVPLMTSRGMIYRARLSGLNRAQATEACRILQDNCLILAAQ